MRLLHTADFHFGKKTHGSYGDSGINSRLIDIKRAVANTCATAKEQEVDGIIIAGDVFEQSTPTPTQQRVAIEAVKELVAVAPVFMTTGNHDHPVTSGLNHANDVFNEIEGVTLVDEPSCVEWQGIHIAALPWPVPAFTEGKLNESIMSLYHTAIKEAAEAEGIGIAVGHFTCKGSLPSGSERALEMSDTRVFPTDMFEGLHYTALGHIHKHQEVAPDVVYSGAPERFTFGEMEPKGSVVVDLTENGATWEFVEHKASQFVSLRVDCAEGESPTSAIIDALKSKDLTGAFVSIEYTASYSAQLQPVQAALDDQNARKLTKLEQFTNQELQAAEEVDFAGVNQRELVKQCLSEQGVDDSMQAEAMTLYDEICRQ